MATAKDWLTQKFTEWEKTQGGRQSYYAFARYLEVGQSGLAQWMMGSATPSGDDLLSIANKLGPEIYDVMGLPRPSAEAQRVTVSFASLPPDLRQRLTSALAELEQSLRNARLRPDTADARKVAIDILAKYGFRYTG
jgi:hypothetical protein